MIRAILREVASLLAVALFVAFVACLALAFEPYAMGSDAYVVATDCTTDSECAALPQCALKPGCDGGPDSEPFRLVGFGCEGADGPLYRDEEDEFPKCERIEAL